MDTKRSTKIALLTWIVMTFAGLTGMADAAPARTYQDPDDSSGNLDVIEVVGTTVRTRADGLVFRTTLTMQDRWLDQDLEASFYFEEVGARWSRCGDDCSGEYYGDIYYDTAERRIRATGFEATNCGCIDFELAAGRSDERSVWFDIPESFLYDGTYEFEITLTTQARSVAEPVWIPACVADCIDEIGPFTFSTLPRA